MSRPDNNPTPVLMESPQQHGAGRQAGSHQSAWIAHELANLLDGGLRNLGLAMSSLRSKPGEQSAHTESAAPTERLQLVDHALRQMASLLRRWMDQATASVSTDEKLQTLRQAVDQAVRLLMPASAQRGIDVYVSLSDDVAQTPAGAVYPIVINALRNSIQAINSVPVNPDGQCPTSGQIKIEGGLRDGQVELEIRDDGPGLDSAMLDDQGRFKLGQTTKPDGHGIGLLLCRDIASSLGGELTLANRAPHGAVLTLRYPLENHTSPLEGTLTATDI